MSLQKYTALLKTAELGSISRAAEQLGYTQSAVSRMIADLENEWGMEVLRRSRAGIEVTSAGRQLLPVVRAIVSGCAELDYTVRELQGVHTGLIQLGTFTTVSDCWIPGLLKAFQQLYPNISFKLLNSESYLEIEDWIRHGKVDCGFVRLPAANDLQSHFLKRDRLVAVLPPEHPMAAAPVFPVAQLEGQPFIKLKVDREIGQFLDHLPTPPTLRYEVSSDHTILSMVESGLGISILHSLMADTTRYRVVYKPLDRENFRDIAIATAKNARLPSAVRLFVDFVRTHIGAPTEQP